MAHRVICFHCGETFDRDKVPYVQVAARRYAHKECPGAPELTELEEYIKKLFNVENLDEKINRQIKAYKEKYNYTYSGMKQALVYFYEVKKNSLDQSNGGIGIIPYIYLEAYNYYLALWEAQKKNENKDLNKYVPTIKEIFISRPTKKIKQKHLFKFLEEEDSE